MTWTCWLRADDEERRGRSREMNGLCRFLLFLFIFRFYLFSCSRWMLIFFFTLGTSNASKSPATNTYIPPSQASPPHPIRSLPVSRTELSSELRPPDADISENDKDDPPPKLGEDRMPPTMRKRWMHREVEAMEEAVASDREVVMQLEEPPGMVGLRIRLKESSGRISWVCFFSFSSRFMVWDSC